MPDLKDVQFEELEAEYKRRKKERREAEKLALLKKHSTAMAYISVLVDLTPAHDTRNCNDNNLLSAYMDHGQARCRRCCLLSYYREKYIPDNVDFKVDIVEVPEVCDEPDV